jgi:rhomboid protease GluP
VLARLLRRFDPLAIITGVCIGLYVLSLAIDPRAAFRGGGLFGILSPGSGALRILGSTHPVDLAAGRWWTLLTAIYLHGGVLHILFNLMWVRALGPEVQRGFGAARFFVIWSLSGAFGFLISDLMPGPGSIGASGSIFGLMAALIVYGRAVGASVMTRQLWGYAIVLGLFGFFFPGVDNLAHVGGFAGGWILATLFRGSLGRPEGRGVTVAALALLGLTVLGFVLSVGTALTILLS